MQVPEHLVSFYAATCGQNGLGLGSDEKEIILLVYVILDALNGQIIGTKEILVRPEGNLIVKDRTNSTSSDVSQTASSPPLAITYSDAANTSTSSMGSSSSNLNTTGSSINSLNITTNTSQNALSSTPISSPTTATSISNCISNSNNNNNNNSAILNNNIINNNNNNITNGTDNIELPIAVAQAAGKPLQEAIEEFDEYLRSLSLYDTNFKIITDGQLPLRQCLHREACVKDITLPAYYNKFSDLRKEFSIYKSGDLSRALVPVKDIKKILQMPATILPQNIAEIMNELNIPSTLEDNKFYIRESRDMVSVIQHLLKAGHRFTANETVSLTLEPGICSIDDEIDGNCIVRARGLPWQSSDQDIAKFFRGLNVAKGGVALCLSPLGRRNGEALIRFISQEHRDMALKRHKHHIGNRYIEVYRATGEDFLSVAGGASNEAQAFLSKGAQVIIRMRGLPYDCTAKQVLDFFTAGDSPCNVVDGNEGVLFVKKPDGRATGDAFVLFATEADAPKALARHRESIGQRYIELFRSTTAEVQQVLNRSMDPKTYEPNHQPPLIAQLPPMQLSLLPQHLITSGTTKNCIRLRGLPYEALVEHILHFLDDFAKHIIFQGVHMVINAQGQPSGEAFIQMDSEDAARLCAQRKHHQFMVFGKKYRYIEVFQCSGDDMNMVLNGGLQSPVPAPQHQHPHMPGGKQQSLLSPGASVIGPAFGHFAPFTHPHGPPAPILTSPHRGHHHHHHHHAAPPPPPPPHAFYPHPLVYWPYPSPPVSPTAYYNQAAHSPTHVPGNHGPPLYSLDYIPTVQASSPTNYANPQASPLSPTTIAIPSPTGGIILSPNKSATPAMTLLSTKQHHHHHQYSTVASGGATAIAPITPYHSKIPGATLVSVPVASLPPPPQRQHHSHPHAHSPTANNVYAAPQHPQYYGTAAPKLAQASLPPPPLIVNGPCVTAKMPMSPSAAHMPSAAASSSSNTLLAIDQQQRNSQKSAIKITKPNNNQPSNSYAPATNQARQADAATEATTVKSAPVTSEISTEPSQSITSNHCVELYSTT